MRQVHIQDLVMEHTTIEPEQVVSTEPQATAAYTELEHLGETDIGIWEMSTGTMQDVEADEVFVVISGAGTIELVDSGETLTLRAGDIVRLHAGERTIWRVSECLRKVYISA